MENVGAALAIGVAMLWIVSLARYTHRELSKLQETNADQQRQIDELKRELEEMKTKQQV